LPLVTDGKIYTGFIRKRRLLALIFEPKIPEIAKKYAEGVSRLTGIPLEKVMKSRPVRNYIKALTRNS